MMDSEIAAFILAAYTVPGLLLAWMTWNSKEYGERIDGYSTAAQFLFVACNTLLWPVVIVKAVSKYREMRRRNRK